MVSYRGSPVAQLFSLGVIEYHANFQFIHSCADSESRSVCCDGFVDVLSNGGRWGRYHVVVLLVGGFARTDCDFVDWDVYSEERRSLAILILGFASLGCWLAILFIMLALTPHAGDLMQVNP